MKPRVFLAAAILANIFSLYIACFIHRSRLAEHDTLIRELREDQNTLIRSNNAMADELYRLRKNQGMR